MLKVSPDELARWLVAHSGGSRITAVTMLTPVKMNKFHRETGEANPWLLGGESMIDHLQERVALLGVNYAAMVNRRWEKCLDPTDDGYVPQFQAAAIWKGKGIHVNPYVVKHVEKGSLYLATFHVKIRQADNWIDKSLQQSAYLHRVTGQPMRIEQFSGFLPPIPKASVKQGCRDGADLELDIDGDTFTVPGGVNPEQVSCRFPHLENVLRLRSFDLQRRGHYDIIDITRAPDAISV